MQQATERMVTVKEAMKRTSLGRTSIYKLVDLGELPKPTRLIGNRVGFPIEVIDAWLAKRIAA